MKTSWENGPHYCQITAYEVVVGSNPGGTGHTDNAGACSHANFLKGEYQDTIQRNLGEEVLQEVITAVKATAHDAQFEAKRDEDSAHWVAWEKIPLNPNLKEWAQNPDDRASNHYQNGPNYSTTLNLSTGATLNLPFESTQGTLVLKDGTVVIIPERSGEVMEYKGFFVIADIHLMVYDFFGKRRFTTRGLEKSHSLGVDIRISDALRCGDKLLALYRNLFMPSFAVTKRILGDYGYLEIDPIKGIMSRCPMADMPRR